MSRRIRHLVGALICTLCWSFVASAGSFRAKVLSRTVISGSVYITLYRFTNPDPIGLIVSSATIEGTAAVSTPEGTFASPDLVCAVPLAMVSFFAVGDKIKVSWTGEADGELVGLWVVEL